MRTLENTGRHKEGYENLTQNLIPSLCLAWISPDLFCVFDTYLK